MHGVGSKEVTIRQRQRLNEINTFLLPRFKYRDALKQKLSKVDDPLIKDAVDEEILGVRNEICETLIRDIADLLDAIIFGWSNHFRNGEARSFIYENLLESVERYNPESQPFCKFTSFFWLYNQNIMRNRLKQMRADKRDIYKTDSLDAIKSSFEDGEGVSLKEFIVSEDDLESRISNNMVLKEIYQRATPKQRMVLKRLYLGYRQNEVADRLKVSGTNINMTIKQMRIQFAELNR